jgi:hypothetical protein
MKPILAAAALLLTLSGCDDTPGEWAAIVYPDAGDRSKYKTTYRFETLSMCRQAAKESIAALPEPAKADYRCGFQCEPDPDAPGRPVCKSSER